MHISLQSSDDLQEVERTLQVNAPYLLVCQTAEEITIQVIVHGKEGNNNSFNSPYCAACFVFVISYPGNHGYYHSVIFAVIILLLLIYTA